MKNVELIKYLQQFDPDGDVSVTIIDKKNRLLYEASEFICITDMGRAAFFFVMGDSEPMEDKDEQ